MTAKWRSSAARELAAAVIGAGGNIGRTTRGKWVITGPDGCCTITEPASESRRDLRKSSAARLIEERTGLRLHR